MKFRFLLISILIIFSFSCKSPTKVILLEERDQIVKTIHEQDSLIVYPRDTTKRIKN